MLFVFLFNKVVFLALYPDFPTLFPLVRLQETVREKAAAGVYMYTAVALVFSLLVLRHNYTVPR